MKRIRLARYLKRYREWKAVSVELNAMVRGADEDERDLIVAATNYANGKAVKAMARAAESLAHRLLDEPNGDDHDPAVP